MGSQGSPERLQNLISIRNVFIPWQYARSGQCRHASESLFLNNNLFFRGHLVFILKIAKFGLFLFSRKCCFQPKSSFYMHFEKKNYRFHALSLTKISRFSHFFLPKLGSHAKIIIWSKSTFHTFFFVEETILYDVFLLKIKILDYKTEKLPKYEVCILKFVHPVVDPDQVDEIPRFLHTRKIGLSSQHVLSLINFEQFEHVKVHVNIL